MPGPLSTTRDSGAAQSVNAMRLNGLAPLRLLKTLTAAAYRIYMTAR